MQMKEPTIAEPTDYSQDELNALGMFKRLQWENECQVFFDHTETLKSDKVIVFSLLLNQCSNAMKVKVKGFDGYEDAKNDSLCLWLLEHIRAVYLDYDATKSRLLSLDQALHKLVNYRQETKSNDDYYKGYMTLVAVYEQQGGDLLHGEGFRTSILKDLVQPTTETEEQHKARQKKALDEAKDGIIAMSLIERSSNNFTALRAELANAYALGNDNYPRTPTATLGVLNSYVAPSNSNRRRESGHTFVQDTRSTRNADALVPGSDG